MAVKDIVEEWLRAHGYDGLYSVTGGCACELTDLMPCDSEGALDCKPGVKGPCNCGEGHDFHIVGGGNKEKKKECHD